MKYLLTILSFLVIASCFAQPKNPNPSNPDQKHQQQPGRPGNPKQSNPDKKDTITTEVKLTAYNIDRLQSLKVKSDTLDAQIKRVKIELEKEQDGIVLQSIDAYNAYHQPIEGTLIKPYFIKKYKVIVKSIKQK